MRRCFARSASLASVSALGAPALFRFYKIFLLQDVVIMAEVLEKFLNEKLAMMPPEEYEVTTGKNNRTVTVKPATSTSNTGEPIEPPAKKGKKTPAKTRSIAPGMHQYLCYELKVLSCQAAWFALFANCMEGGIMEKLCQAPCSVIPIL